MISIPKVRDACHMIVVLCYFVQDAMASAACLKAKSNKTMVHTDTNLLSRLVNGPCVLANGHCMH